MGGDLTTKTTAPPAFGLAERASVPTSDRSPLCSELSFPAKLRLYRSDLEAQHFDLQLPKKTGLIDRILSPDEACASIGLMHPKFKTPGKAVNYIERFFDDENPVGMLGKNAVLPLNLDLRYYLNPKSERPSLLFLNVASAVTTFNGEVSFLKIPFSYEMQNETYRLGLGYQLCALPKDSDFNIGLRARLDAYYSDISVKGVSPVWTERFHNRGLGCGASLGVSVEQKLNTKGFDWLPKDVWLFAGAEYSCALIADYASINGPTAYLGFRVNLGR